MHDSLFREYDLRGKVGSELSLEHVYDLGRALAYYFVHQDVPVKTIAVGMDGRIHSPVIKQELVRAFCDSGIDVIFVGVCPTPVLYFSMHTIPVDAGIMITASHNGKEYNGIKIVLAKAALWGSQLQLLKQFFLERKEHKTLKQGDYTQYPMVKRYTNWLVKRFAHLKKSPLSLILDMGNGATGVVVPELIEQLEWDQAQLLYADIDGTFPNHEPDPVVPENMQIMRSMLIEGKAQFGIGFDGDGDRMVVYNHLGQIIEGDKLLALFARDILQQFPGSTILYDIKCARFVPELIQSWSGKAIVSRSGHSIIKHEMKKHQAIFGGELSCHFFFNDSYFGYDDGIYAALRLCQLMHKTGDLQALLDVIPQSYSTPEIRIACAQEIHTKLIASTYNFFSARQDAQVSTLDGVHATLPYGWGLVRASQTQPSISLRFESSTPEGLEKVKEDFYTALKSYMDPLLLQSSFDHTTY